jgi:hypothetical protein
MSRTDRELQLLTHDMIEQLITYGENYRRVGTMSKEETLIRRSYDLIARMEVTVRDLEDEVKVLQEKLWRYKRDDYDS